MDTFYKQIVLFLFICVILLLLTYVYTCVWNANDKCKLFIKEGFKDDSEQIGTCYQELKNYENCLKSLDESIYITPVEKSQEVDKLKNINNELTKVQQLLIEKSNYFNNNKQSIQELLGGGGAGEWLSLDTKQNIEYAIVLKERMLKKYEIILSEITSTVNILKDNWNDTQYENALNKLISVENDINKLFVKDIMK